MFSTRIRQVATHLNRRFVASTASRSSSATTSSSSSSLFSYSSSYSSSRSYADWILVGVVATTASLIHNKSKDRKTTLLAASLPSSGDIISAGVPLKEPATGILFPQLCNGYYFAGCGVRVKYGFVKVYAVGTYIDPLAMSAVIKNTKESKNQNVVEEALLNPTYPRTIRIVMNRSLSIDKYTAAIIDALKPRMMGQDLEKLEEFKALNPKVDLVEGTFLNFWDFGIFPGFFSKFGRGAI